MSGRVITNPLAKGQRLRALGRFWLWQVRRRTTKRPVVVHLSHGGHLWLQPSHSLAGLTIATGAHEPEEESFVTHFLRPGDFVCDVGANIGIYTVLMARLGACVLAFEPSTAAREQLAYNVASNELNEPVRLYPYALGNESAPVILTLHLDSSNRIEPTFHRGSTEVVLMRSLDQLLSEEIPEGWAPVTLIKVDAEGRDLDVLHGAKELIARERPIVVVETWNGGRDVRDFLGRMDYRFYRYCVRSRSLEEFPKSWSHEANLIAVSSDEYGKVRRRLDSSTRGNPRVCRIEWNPDKGWANPF